jgi:hypothetical protein
MWIQEAPAMPPAIFSRRSEAENHNHLGIKNQEPRMDEVAFVDNWTRSSEEVFLHW